MEIVLDVKELSKTYGGRAVLQNLSFEVRQGTCFGLLGPNGAGKSTTMKILSGIIEADAGAAAMFGRDALRRSDEVRKLIGYVPQSITLYEKISAYDNLVFFGEMYGVTGGKLKKRIADVLEQVGLADRAREAVTTFSGGMKRRINIAAALLHQPKLIILDEPTVGIDPQSRNHIFEMIRDLKRQGVTLIYSTHYMEEVEALCDDVAIIDQGRVIVQGGLQELLSRHGGTSVYVEADGAEDVPLPAGIGSVSRQGGGYLIESSDRLDAMRLIAASCIERGVTVSKLEIVRPSLETVFLNLTGTSLRDS